MRNSLNFLAVIFFSNTVTAQVTVLDDGRLQTQTCAYGRGALTISAAKDKAALELAEFIKGMQTLTFADSHQTLDTTLATHYETHRHQIIEGLNQGTLPLKVENTVLSGNDTCATVSLAINQAKLSDTVQWQDTVQEISVTVIGEGWPKDNETALQRAEQDALSRAVSQVVGVWLTQQRSESSQTVMQVHDDELTKIRDIIGQQLVTKTSGLVKEWQMLDRRQLANGGVQVTINAVIEKAPLIQQSTDLLATIGSPRVKVNALIFTIYNKDLVR